MRRIPLIAALTVAALALGALAWFALQYTQADPEVFDLDDTARQSAPGSFIRTSAGTVHYELAGPADGRIVVLIHGFSVPAYLWDPTFQALTAAGFKVLRYDQFGRGFSDRPNARYDGAFFDRQLLELLGALHIAAPVDLVGASMGGPIAAGFVCRHPNRARSLVLFDPGYSHGQTLPWNFRLPIIGDYNFAVKMMPRMARSQLADFLHPERFPDWPKRYEPQMRYHGFRRALLATLRHYLAEDWSREFACVGQGTAPVLLVWGKHDQDVPFATSREVLAAIPRATFLPVEDAAHVPFLEHPEITDPALVAFLTSSDRNR